MKSLQTQVAKEARKIDIEFKRDRIACFAEDSDDDRSEWRPENEVLSYGFTLYIFETFFAAPSFSRSLFVTFNKQSDRKILMQYASIYE